MFLNLHFLCKNKFFFILLVMSSDICSWYPQWRMSVRYTVRTACWNKVEETRAEIQDQLNRYQILHQILSFKDKWWDVTRVKKRLAEKIAEKCRESHASVMTYIRTKLRFSLLRSTLAAIWGLQGKRKPCSPPGSHRHWIQFNSQAHNHVKLNYGIKWHHANYICAIGG